MSPSPRTPPSAKGKIGHGLVSVSSSVSMSRQRDHQRALFGLAVSQRSLVTPRNVKVSQRLSHLQ